MRLVFLHGPPAAGKLTVAQVLLRLVPRANCLTVDSEAGTPDDTAREIIRHFRLDIPETRQPPSR